MKFDITNDIGRVREYLDGLIDNPDRPFSVFDLETKNLDAYKPTILMPGFWDFDRDPFVAYTDAVFEGGIPEEELVELLAEYMPKLTLIGHNIKFDLGVLKAKNIPDPQVLTDTILMCHMWDPDQLKQLEVRVTKDLGYPKKSYKQIIGKTWDKIDWDKDVRSTVDKKGNVVPPLITPENMGEYLAEDVFWTGKLYDHYKGKLTRGMNKVLYDIELPLMWTLRDMHYNGVRIDPDILYPLDDKLGDLMTIECSEVYKLAGSVFNLNSSQQKAKILYDKLKLPVIKTTKKGAPSTDAPTLKIFAERGYEICQHLVDYSKYETLQTMYTRKLPGLIDPDGRLRGSFNATGAASGRLSSSDPNLQNIPTRSEEGRIIRQAFIPHPGWDMWVADMSQIEPRIMTHMSEDPGLIKIYLNKGDIYQGLADALGISRDDAKIVVLAITYGLGPNKLARSIGVSKNEAFGIIRGFYKTYPVFDKWKQGIERYAKTHKQVSTLFGRIRKFPDLGYGSSEEAFSHALRAAFNTVIQGSAADMLKIAMIKTDERLKGKQGRLLLTVHDEIAGESPRHETKHCIHTLIDCMENTVKLKVPVIAEHKIVYNWSQMKDKKFPSINIDTPKGGILSLLKRA